MTKIALIVLDTLRKDVFDEYFDWLPGKRFESAFSTSHWTVPAHASLFTGQYASDVGAHAKNQSLNYDGPVLAESLSDAGYQTLAFSANGHIGPYFEFDRGYDEFRCDSSKYNNALFRWSEHLSGGYKSVLDAPVALLRSIKGEYDTIASIKNGYQHLCRDYPFLPDPEPTGARKALSFIEDQNFQEDSFLFMNLMEMHSPYKPPRKYRRMRYSGEDIENKGMFTFTGEHMESRNVWQAYKDCARYVSDIFQKIFHQLESFDYIITLSDHGESFGEEGVWGHPYGLHPAITNVPLIISGPSRSRSTCMTPVNLLDIYTTIMSIAELESNTAGHSLIGGILSHACLTEYHGITHAEKLEKVREAVQDEQMVQAYDEPRFGLALNPNYYGYESIDGYKSEGEAEIEQDPLAVLATLKSGRPSLSRDQPEFDDDVRSQLEKLGYL